MSCLLSCSQHLDQCICWLLPQWDYKTKHFKTQWLKETIVYSCLCICRSAGVWLVWVWLQDVDWIHLRFTWLFNLPWTCALARLRSTHSYCRKAIECTSIFESCLLVFFGIITWWSPKSMAGKDTLPLVKGTSVACGKEGEYKEAWKIRSNNSSYHNQCMAYTGGLLDVRVWLCCSLAFSFMGPFPHHRVLSVSLCLFNQYLTAPLFTSPQNYFLQKHVLLFSFVRLNGRLGHQNVSESRIMDFNSLGRWWGRFGGSSNLAWNSLNSSSGPRNMLYG